MWCLIMAPLIFSLELPADSSGNWDWNDSSSVLIIDFSECMDTTGLRSKSNYVVIDSDSNVIKVYGIAVVEQIGDSIYAFRQSVALITERIEYLKQYTVTVDNVKDTSGNLIRHSDGKNKATFKFIGISNNVGVPSIDIRKKE